MRKNKERYLPGKLSHHLLDDLLSNFVTDLQFNDERVVMGSKIGEDAAIIDTDGENYLVVKSDPVTFTTDEIGYYVVNVNVNDVVCTGATPKWFQSTLLLPEKVTDDHLIRSIFKGIHDTCQSMNISVIGGHTEVTTDLNRPIVVGTLIGEVKKDKLILTSEAEPGDVLILTKGIFVEGTSIIAREKEEKLKSLNFNSEFISKCKNFLYNPGISVYKEALLVSKHFRVDSMHDPTEGGLLCGIAEMAIASENGIIIEKEKIKIFPESLELSKAFSLDPYSTISSGSLLIAAKKEDSKNIIKLLRENSIYATIIGDFTENRGGYFFKDKKGNLEPFKYSEIDEITKIF